MKDKATQRWNTYESFYIALGEYKVADIVVTHHAVLRYKDRVGPANSHTDTIATELWECLKQGRIAKYYRNEEDVYVIDNDLVLVAEFAELTGETDITGNPLHKMIIITFLGKMSETIELRDLKSYYSWLRHSRRTTLMKNSRKRK
ncbi:hypothetical protein [Paenibacillus caui]|uniref:hypothetical protein n=1 Tax=Paenibacillus caui TaxID=2873927 RepID=UPI001CA99608|nr:hypothetical protein [Paenibacillus caui]